jgi:CTP:molybdopterin cytidylyltransferase MocA
MLTSSHSRVVMLIMTGSGEGSEVERMVAQARQAITLDIVDKALTVEAVDRVIVSTNSRSLAEKLRGKPVCIELDAPGEEFHFGRQLLALINKHKIEKLFYVGGGSGPLLSAEEIGHIAEDLLSADQLLIANNFYSTDFAAFTPASVLKDADPPAFDNDLGWLLGETLGLPIRELPRTAATQLDVDTPMDLMTLQLHPAAGRHLQRYLEGLDLDISYLEGAIKFFTDREAMVVVAGRISAATWTYLESETACQVRLFAEERGMRASGRQARAEVRSLLGFYLDEVGVERFFATLSTLGQAAFIDSRVIFAHRGLWPPAADRFYSDLRQPEKIADPFVRHFTEAAMQAPIPVVLGGHSLVAGGLYALIEAAWARGKDLPRHIVPQLGI